MRVIAATAILFASSAAAAADIEGRWRSPGGNTIIEIGQCGATFCGTVAWASEKSKREAAKTTPQLVGSQLLTGLAEKKPGSWHGKLFIPDRNMRVNAKISLVSPEKLKVAGCAMGVICSSQVWNRYEGALPD